MSRNLDYRVETMVPVQSPELQTELEEILNLQLADDRKAWELEPSGSWRKLRPAEGEPSISSQAAFMERALRRAGRSAP
jgi:polyphosphate kinase